MDIIKIINTIKYMNIRQITYRLRYELTKITRRNIKVYDKYKVNKEYKFKNFNNVNLLDIDRKKIIETADDIINNRFTFLNVLTFEFGNEIDWNLDPFQYRLWNFNLNYFDYLDYLAEAYEVTKNSDYISKGIELITSWIDKNKRYNYNTWDPYVVSKRIYNFINFISYYKNIVEDSYIDLINISIITQGVYLSKNIEYYLDANHILMDAKGIIFFGVYVKEDKIIKDGVKILIKEYKRQVLHDGGHYEKSPSYQVEVLSHYVESYLLLDKNGFVNYAEELFCLIEKMSSYLQKIIMPNGFIPLLNDSSLDYPFEADDILQVCSFILNRKLYSKGILSKYFINLLGEKGIEKIRNIPQNKVKSIKNVVLNDSGYYIIRDSINREELYILVDCGDGGPDCNLGHSHADNLNILINLGGNDIFIDAGTFTYKTGNDRNNYRSTMVHNTISIDNKSSSEVWGGFRVAKRAKSYLFRYVDESDYSYISAYHDGYCKVLNNDKIFHNREIVYIKGKAIFIVDTLYGNMKNEHIAIMNYNVLSKVFNINKNEFLTPNNKVKISINNKFNVIRGKYSNEFSIEKECLNIKSKIVFNRTRQIVTSLILNDSLVSCNIDDDIISIFDNNNKVKEIKR